MTLDINPWGIQMAVSVILVAAVVVIVLVRVFWRLGDPNSHSTNGSDAALRLSNST